MSTSSSQALPDGVVDAIENYRYWVQRADEDIIAALKRRIKESHSAQRMRVHNGGRRQDHAQEIVVVDRYADELGTEGRDIALAILALCRMDGDSQ